ncbi:serine hydrolase domain-containing protein [Ascoidea rubescens DSM 1968]|uniref:Beta-lactamase n=1 Tax=Ascoidea rubescens DSM 1968 TaxID=1344418 RepID=A0A1D2VKK0_9ASCO|nr:beta-lactamase [Ascoidea rubescens DSM 1968]ODV62131.1 beta-lactamase [Ascoidea rubescens DSM 1968]
MASTSVSASSIDQILQKYTSLSENPVPGIIAGIVDNRKGLVYLGSAGAKSLSDPHDKVSNDSTVAFYSTTKAITVTAFLQLLESGKIHSINDLVEDYIPELKNVTLLSSFEENGNPILTAPKTKPTLLHLVTHTAGFAYAFFNENYKKLQEKTGSPNILASTWKEFDTPLNFEPGSQWEYGSNIDFLGKVVENVSGLTLDQYFKKYIFEPLDIQSLTFIRTPQHFSNHTSIHQRDYKTKKTVALPELHPAVPEFHCGGHGLFGKVEDYLKFLEIFLHNGKSPTTNRQILKPETIQNYCFASLLPKGLEIVPLPASQPNLSNPVEIAPGVPKTWTANWLRIDSELPTGRSSGSFMWAGLTNLYYWVDPKKGIAGFFAAQLFPFYDPNCLSAFQEFETAAYQLLNK